MNSGTGYSWKDITLADGPCSGPSYYTDLRIQANANATDPAIVVQLNTLTVGKCGRVIILGNGPIDLRIGAPTAQSFTMLGKSSGNAQDHFGVTSADTQASVVLVPVAQLTVSVLSDGTGTKQATTCTLTTTCAVYLQHVYHSGTFLSPNGGAQLDDNEGLSQGAFIAKQFAIDNMSTLHSDTSGLTGGGGGGGTNFSTLRSWKDQ